jgi:hypothetical protein
MLLKLGEKDKNMNRQDTIMTQVKSKKMDSVTEKEITTTLGEIFNGYCSMAWSPGSTTFMESHYTIVLECKGNG